MRKPVTELERILKEEIDIYASLYRLEEKKTDAIVDRNGKLIQQLSTEQEAFITRISSLESDRIKQVENYKSEKGKQGLPGDVSLKDLVNSINDENSHRLIPLGMELKKLLSRIKSISDANMKLLKDNMEFFNLLLSGIKSSMSIKTGYSRKGLEESRVANPLILNRIV
jgi:flagellar biosynthesis/type III secretory pathway chaperone